MGSQEFGLVIRYSRRKSKC